MQCPTGYPTSLTAGDSVAFTVSFASFPASLGWSCKYCLTRRGAGVSSQATASGDSFNVALTPTETAVMLAGSWSQCLIFSKGATRRTVTIAEPLRVSSDPTNPKKNRNREIADNLESVIAGRALPFMDVESSTINGQEIVNMSSADLLIWLKFYESRANAEDAASGAGRNRGPVRPFFL